MIIHNHWKTYRLAIIVGMIACFLWLFYRVIPSSGFFRLSVFGAPFVENGASIVFVKEGKNINAYSLSSYTLGWLVIKDTWPLILFGILLGYPLGEYVSGKAYGDYEALLRALVRREEKAKRMMEEARGKSSELENLQYTIQVLQAKLYHAEEAAEERRIREIAFRRKYRSLENDLHKARANTRRQKKKKSPGKWIDAEPWPE